MRNLPWRAFVVGLLLALGVGYALRPTADREPPPSVPAPSTPEPAPSAPDAAAPVDSPTTGAPPMAKAGGTLELDRASFPSSGPVRVALELPVAPADAEPRPVQVFSEGDNRVFDTQGRLDSERSAATIDLDPNFLRPGSYLVQMKTAEPGVMPLRRYVIVVR